MRARQVRAHPPTHAPWQAQPHWKGNVKGIHGGRQEGKEVRRGGENRLDGRESGNGGWSLPAEGLRAGHLRSGPTGPMSYGACLFHCCVTSA